MIFLTRHSLKITPKPITWTLRVLTLTAMVLLSGCQLWPSKTNQAINMEHNIGSNAGSIEGPTVGETEQQEIKISVAPLPQVPVEQSLKSYQQILKHSDDPEARQRVLRRMADLTMMAAENEGIEDIITDTDQTAIDGAATSGTLIKIDEYQNQYLDIGYENAITLYESFLQSGVEGSKRAETYYLLAKVYDLMGEIERSLEMLNRLVLEHPESTYYQEAQFRRGEILFSDGDFHPAADAYHQILSRRNNQRFYQQAIYKYGWSLFKLSEYHQAGDAFFELLDYLMEEAAQHGVKKSARKLLSDTQRVISLTYSHLDGPKSLQAKFEKMGGRNYESEIYAALSDLYLHQERYKDAADSYQTFISVHPLHALAPSFQSSIIAAYTKGGFPSLILPAKEDYVTQFGAQSEFWQVYHQIAQAQSPYNDIEKQTLKALKPELKKHLWDIASHYHALAQKSTYPAGYLIAANWYQQLLATFIQDDDARQINLLLAESLFSGRKYAEAIIEFNHTANDYSGVSQANADASYFALVAYQKLLSALPKEAKQTSSEDSLAGSTTIPTTIPTTTPTREDWIKKKIRHGLMFSERYSFDQRVPQILDAARIDQLFIKDLAGAVETSRWIVVLNPAPTVSLQKKAWLTIADGEFDLTHYARAERAYKTLLDFQGFSANQRLRFLEQQVTSIYKQGEILRDNNLKLLAAEQFLRVGQVFPNSKIRPNAEFDAANLYLEENRWPQAIEVLTRFRSLYSDNKLVDTIPDKLALAYESTQQWALAAIEMETISNRYQDTDIELSRQTLWHAAELRDKAQQTEQAIRVYKKYIWGFEQPLEQRAEAQFRLVNLYGALNDTLKRNFWLSKLQKNYLTQGDKNTDRTLYLAAWATFTLADPVYKSFLAVQLTLPLKKSLKAKQRLMKQTLEAYRLVLEIGVADFTTASTFRMGEIYRQLAVELIASERPSALNDIELEQYEILLEEQALPIEDQAIEIHESNTELVLQLIYDEWVRKSFTSLRELLPARYKKDEKSEQFVNEIL